VLFHDGAKLTPEIAAAALRYSVAHPGSDFALSFTSIKSVSVSGDDSIEVKLSEPNSFVLSDLALVSVRRPDNQNIGTGPFRVEKQDDQRTIFTAFPQYFRGRPAVDQIDVTTYPTQRTAWAALMRGEVDMLHEVSLDAGEFLKQESTFNLYSFRRPYYIPLVFNVRHPILKEAAVRRAINEALDRTALIRQGMGDRGRPADGPIWPEHWAYSAPLTPFVFDPDTAMRHFEAAGLRVQQRNDGRMPSRLSFTCLILGEDPRFERLAVLVQKQLAEVGVDMKLLPLKQKELEARFKSGDFDAFLFEMFGRSLSWAYEFWHSQKDGHINGGYTAADSVFDRIRGARSDDEVRAGVAELARTLHDDPPAAFIAWQETTRAISTNFNVDDEKDRDILANVWQWHMSRLRTQATR
jgi:peptide/nickel transport system substrate-binding protein